MNTVEHIERLDVADFDELIVFLNRAFNLPPSHTFDRLVPTLYRREEAAMRRHFAIRREGRLAAVATLHPLTWRVGRATLRAAAIGGVAADPRWRGQGLMSALLRHIQDVIRAEGLQLTWLGGQRQRYARYGWERAGVTLRADLTSANLRHVLGADWKPGVRLEFVADDSPHLPALQALHDAQPVCCERPPDLFPLHLRQWRNMPYAAFDAGGRLVGYACLWRDNSDVGELVAVGGSAHIAIAAAAMDLRQTGRCSVRLGMLDRMAIDALSPLCERWHVEESGNWQIVDWPAVIGALLEARRAATALPAGDVVVGIEGQPRQLALRVAADAATCAWTDAPAVVSGTALQMTQLLGGPLRPSTLRRLPPPAALLDAWCPLPLQLPTQDHG